MNDVAAFPSLHAAFPMLITIFFWSRIGSRRRAVLVAYTVAMALTLVISGEHYMVDVLGGWIVVAVVVLVWKRLSAQSSVSRWLTS